MLGLDVCGFHSICSVYRAFGPVILVAFRLLVVFMGDWGGTRLAFTALVVLMGALAVNIFCGVYGVCIV